MSFARRLFSERGLEVKAESSDEDAEGICRYLLHLANRYIQE
jgi:hypothetical protein